MLRKIRHKMMRENRIYILPSGRGFLFLFLDVVVVLTAATYNNNLIFILAFFLFSVFAVSMVQTHYNLKGVRLRFLSAEDAFEGDSMGLLFELEQGRFRHKRALEVRSLSRYWKTLAHEREDISNRDLRKPVRIAIQAFRRGVHPLPVFALETFFPLGLFRAWKVFRLEGQLVVYPKPWGSRPLIPTSHDHGEEDLGLRTSPEGDFGELKNYQAGESYHQIAWKHFARTGHLYTKVHWGEEHKHYHIPWEPQSTYLENYLSQMSSWVKIAVEDGATFSMDVPQLSIAPGSGPDQARECWRALARVRREAA